MVVALSLACASDAFAVSAESTTGILALSVRSFPLSASVSKPLARFRAAILPHGGLKSSGHSREIHKASSFSTAGSPVKGSNCDDSSMSSQKSSQKSLVPLGCLRLSRHLFILSTLHPSWQSSGQDSVFFFVHFFIASSSFFFTAFSVHSSIFFLFSASHSFYCHSVMLAVLAAGTAAQGAHFVVWTFISDNYIQIITANILLAYATATYVYVHSFSVKPGNKELRELAEGGQSGNMLYDWFIGRELNPRVTLPFIGEIDLKEWLELRPGMFGWVLMNFVWMAKQHRTFGYVTDSMVLISVVQALYVVDSWWNESAILTTMDITTDGFGMMLAFGDFVWEPFAYALQTRYLAHHPVHLGPVYLTLMLAIIAAGYYIFRAANSQKNRFRINPDDPQVAHLNFIETKSGSKLLTSGWWGVSRHINYLGDWLQAWAYCLPCGVAGYEILSAGSNAPGSYLMKDGREVIQGEARGWAIPITCFYIIYFAVLLIHREGRDDVKCHRKYGKDWDRYKTIVRAKIIPGMY